MSLLEGEWVTVSEAATRLGLTVDGVRKRVDRGTLESRKAMNGRVQVLIPPDVIDQRGVVAADEMSLAHVEQGVGLLIDLVRAQAEEIGDLKRQVKDLTKLVRSYRTTEEDRRMRRLGDDSG